MFLEIGIMWILFGYGASDTWSGKCYKGSRTIHARHQGDTSSRGKRVGRAFESGGSARGPGIQVDKTFNRFLLWRGRKSGGLQQGRSRNIHQYVDGFTVIFQNGLFRYS